jgi:hypothetical protein
MSIFIVYIGIIGPLFHFDHTNFKASLVIKIVNFSEIVKGPFSYACHLPCECDYLSKLQSITHLLNECTINLAQKIVLIHTVIFLHINVRKYNQDNHYQTIMCSLVGL